MSPAKKNHPTQPDSQKPSFENANPKNTGLVDTIENIKGIGIWKLNIQTGENDWSEEFFKICGLNPKNTIPSTELRWSIIHPEDREEAKQAFENSITTGNPYKLEKRITLPNGDIKHIESEGRVSFDEHGKPLYLIGTYKDITDLKLNENQLIQTTDELDSILENSIDLIFIFDKDGVISKISKSVEETLGYSKEEIIGREYTEFVYPADLQKTRETSDQIREGLKIRNFKNRYLNSEGKLIHFNWSASLKKGSDDVLAIARDITELEEIKKSRKQDNFRIQTILNTSPDLIWSLDRDFKLVSANSAFKKILKESINWEIKERDNLLSIEKYGSDYVDIWKNHYEKALSGKKIKVEDVVKTQNSETPCIYETKINPIKIKGNVVGLACFSRNITEKRNAAEKIKQLNKRLLKGQEMSKIGYWESNLITNQIFWSDEMYRIWEVKKSDSDLNFDFFFESIHPEDKKNFLYHRNRAITKEKNLDVVYRIISKKGKVKHIHELGELVEDDKNGEQVFRGTAQEITKEKETEIQLRDRNFFIESTLNNIPLGIAVNKISDGEATYMNKAFEEVYGWPKEEIVSVESFFKKVYPNPEYREWIQKRIMDDILSGDPERMTWRGIVVTTKDGKEKIVNAKNIPVPDLNLMISTVADDTERYWAEEALKISNDRFKLVSEAVSDAIWDWDLEKSTIFWGRGYHRLFGYPESKNQVDESAWLESIHPDDYKDIWHSILEARKNPKQKFWSGEYRFKRFDGSYAYVDEKTIIIRNSKGDPVRMVGALQDITKEKERENHLKLLESVVTNTTDAILITNADPDEEGYKIIYANQSFVNMTGYSQDEILGKTPKILQGNDTDLEKMKRFGKELREWKSTSVEVINYKKDGTPFWVNIVVVPVADESGWYTHWVGIQRDITEKKQREQELELMNERFKMVSEATNDAIWDWDVKNGNHFWGEGFSKLFGIDLSKKKNDVEEWEKRIHPEDREKVLAHLQLILENPDQKEFQVEYRFQKNETEYAYVLDSGTVIRDQEGKPTRLVGAVQDISAQKDYENSLKKLNETLEKANKELELSNQELEQFAYVASHDLQEPLRMISSFLGLIEKRYDTVLDEKGKRYIHFAVEGSKRMRQIILDLLEFSKLDNFQESKVWIESSEILEISKLFLKKPIQKNNPIFYISKLPKVFGHKSTLIQLFQNLISNAIKYQPEGQKPEIWISAKDKKNEWEFAFKDNGIGIEKDYLEKIFVIFQRLHVQESYSGTGIGLAISKKIVDMHGGKIWVDSTPSKGSTFYFTIQKPIE
jgi:PAS domain S-box-containing protein